MTNYEKWSDFMRDVGSPQSYIDFGFYYMMSVALQRRVWLGDEDNAIFPNTFIILVGGPGVGKGQVIHPMATILKSLKTIKRPIPGDVKEAEVDTTQPVNGKTKVEHESYLFPFGSDATTFEALMQSHSSATRCVLYKTKNKEGKEVTKTSVYASIYFLLEELGSMVRKQQDNTLNYLQTAYDCRDFEYKTKHQGEDIIKKPSLCIFAGTNPDFMETTLNEKILNQGFAARSWFIFENKSRFDTYDFIRHSAEQKQYRAEICAHLRNLSTLHGECKLTPEADEYLKHWWEKIHPNKRQNTSTKLEYFYVRKKVHVWKLCMLIHFSESLEMVIGIETAKKALELFDGIEEKMHHALAFDNTNPLFALSKRILTYLRRRGETSRVELLMEFFGQCNDMQLNETLSFMIITDKIEAVKTGVYRAKNV